MKGFSYNGGIVRVVKYDENSLHNTLQPQVYTLNFSQEIGFFLTITAKNFELGTIYGKTLARANKVINTYAQRTTSTGTLLTGDKGSGKSLLSKVICNKMIDKGLPVILINANFAGNGFVEFMNDIGECVIFFDEFAKTYTNETPDGEEDSQKYLLSFLDGTSNIKRLLLFTENNRFRINEFLIDRPGRIYYHFKYGKLDEDTIVEVCSKLLTNPEQQNDIIEFSRMSIKFSMDILKAIIEEANRFPTENIFTLVEDLNIPNDKDSYQYKVIELIHIPTNKPIKPSKDTFDEHEYLRYLDPEKSEDKYTGMHIELSQAVYSKGNIFILETKTCRVTLERIEKIFDSSKYAV